ncbi:hypothetical protein [Streptomyces sp. NPDC049555]|uniref:hypothetical protein n=1 Tax=Streptomyces sp. NPDC049555 TaxID=3154930 RepID=UPI0034352A13
MQIARMYKLAKGSAVEARTQAINRLKAVLLSADPNLREELDGRGKCGTLPLQPCPRHRGSM